MRDDLRSKFEAKGLEESDRIPVKSEILTTTDPHDLQILIYMYGYSFPPDDDIAAICLRHIRDEPYPGLTAACMNVLADIWRRPDDLLDSFSAFLNRSMIEKWYDEAIFIVGFLEKNPDIIFPPDLLRGYIRLKSDPAAMSWIRT